jgi:hypothetical protein
VSEALGPDADGLPLFPPLPGGRAVQPPGARSVARLVAGLRTAVLAVLTDELAAMVVFVDHEPVDGVAVRGSLRVVGADALDEVADAPVEDVTVTEVTPELARVVGSYFLPTEMRGVPAGLVAPDDFVRSLARPGQRGCLLVRAGGALGMVFLAGGRVVLAYREDGPVGGFEQVAPLFGLPGATLWARLGPDAETTGEVAAIEAPLPHEPEPPVLPVRVAPEPPAVEAAEPELHDAAPTGGAPPGAAPPGAAPLDAALDAAREVLGTHAVRVEAALRRAEPTVEGLRAAAESLRGRRVRLLSPATMELVADRVVAALDPRDASARRP